MLALPEPERRAGFFRCWTRKEAMLKATGTGLSFPLDRFTVTVGHENPPRVLAIDDPADDPAAWRLAHLTPGPDYLAALAIRFAPGEFQLWRWS